MKTCKKCKYLTLCDEYINARQDIGADVFICEFRNGRFNPSTAERCEMYRLSDEELYEIAERTRKHFAEHPEEVERLRKKGEALRTSHSAQEA